MSYIFKIYLQAILPVDASAQRNGAPPWNPTAANTFLRQMQSPLIERAFTDLEW
jgi:hypothetical protein